MLDEYQVKAAFLFNFAKFVEWPAQFSNASPGSVVLCVFGQNPFGNALDAVSGRRVGMKTFIVREISDASLANQCHILFLAGSERKRTSSILGQLKGASILTVGEADDFISSGGIVAFKLKDARVRFEIDAVAAERAKLQISSKLLSLGDGARK